MFSFGVCTEKCQVEVLRRRKWLKSVCTRSRLTFHSSIALREILRTTQRCQRGEVQRLTPKNRPKFTQLQPKSNSWKWENTSLWLCPLVDMSTHGVRMIKANVGWIQKQTTFLTLLPCLVANQPYQKLVKLLIAVWITLSFSPKTTSFSLGGPTNFHNWAERSPRRHKVPKMHQLFQDNPVW